MFCVRVVAHADMTKAINHALVIEDAISRDEIVD
jgi:hypothetical protein